MARNNRLNEESRMIRKAVNEGKTTTDIMEMLSLSKRQIRYRLETRYSKRISKSVFNRLDKNDSKVKEEIKKSKRKQSSNKSLVVDTCSLKKNGAFEFIMSYSSIILILDVVRELEKYKSDTGILGINIRKLLAESARDKEGKKIKVEIAKKISNYTDENLINFCKEKDVILYTADNAMATKARAYGIEYIIAEDMQVEETEKIETKKTTVSNVSVLGKDLILEIPQTYKIGYIVLENDLVKKPITKNIIKLEKGNIVLVMTYKLKHNGLCISRYEITHIQSENHSIYLGADKISDMYQIALLDLPQEAKKEVRNYFSLVRKR